MYDKITNTIISSKKLKPENNFDNGILKINKYNGITLILGFTVILCIIVMPMYP